MNLLFYDNCIYKISDSITQVIFENINNLNITNEATINFYS